MEQSQLGNQLDQSSLAHNRAVLRYGKANRDAYIQAANLMERSLAGPDRNELTRLRVAFAVLSANCPFQSSVDALAYVRQVGLANVEESSLARFQCVPVKARACREIASKPIQAFLRQVDETWQEYRERLARETLGLGRAKASFAACLIYPTRADLACVDTWICKVYLGRDSFKSLSRVDYERVEGEVRKIRDKIGFPSTFLAQWCIWNHARGDKPGQVTFDHSFLSLPGSHKGTESSIPPF